MKRKLAAFMLAGLTSLMPLKAISQDTLLKGRSIEVIVNYSSPKPDINMPSGFSKVILPEGDIGLPEQIQPQKMSDPKGNYSIYSLGISINPFTQNGFRNFRLGYNYNSNDRLSGKSEKPMLSLGDPFSSAFSTYQKISANYPRHEFFASFKIPFRLLTTVSNLEELGLELGYANSSSYKLNAEQGINLSDKKIVTKADSGKSSGFSRYYANLYAYITDNLGVNLGYSRANSRVDWEESKNKDLDYNKYSFGFSYRF